MTPTIKWPRIKGVERKLNRTLAQGRKAENRMEISKAGNIAYQLNEILAAVRDLDMSLKRASTAHNRDET